MRLPDYDELPIGDNGRPRAWDLYEGAGPDNVGRLNLQTPDRVAAAARLVRRGAVFPLNIAVDLFQPSLASRRSLPRHQVVVTHLPGAITADDVYDNFFPQGNSQWDSLAHVGYDSEHFYNGATEAEIRGGTRNTIQFTARKGIAGRGVILDLAQTEGYDPGSSHAFSVADLERAREHAGVEFEPGDVLVLHTGFLGWYEKLDASGRSEVSRGLRAPGVEHTEQMCRYLWNTHASAIVSDTFAVEVWPPALDPAAGPFGFLHPVLIGGFGISLGELWQLDELVTDCRDDGVYECLLVSAPLNLPAGIGSTANAVALK